MPGVRRNPRVCGRHSRWEGSPISDNLTPRIEQLAPELEKIISTSEPIEHLADGFGGAQGPAEGPLWWEEGGYLLFSAARQSGCEGSVNPDEKVSPDA